MKSFSEGWMTKMAKKNKTTYQLDLFCDSDNLYKITKPIRLIEFFAGVGFQRMGIQKVFPNLESWHICEWAIPSIVAYDAVHTNYDDPFVKANDWAVNCLSKEYIVNALFRLGVSKDYNVPATEKELNRIPLEKLQSIYLSILNTHNLVNIMNVKGEDLEITDTDKYEYVVTYSFPCQDLSLAGTKKGMSVSQKEGGTRSGLVWEFLRIIKECENKPQILLMENVPQIHSKDNNGEFYFLQTELQKLGYKNFWQDMNAKHYGIPQNRDRTFMLSIYDKDADYVFPEPEPLKVFLEDLLEDNVDESYYLSDDQIEAISKWNAQEKPLENAIDLNEKENIVGCITARGAGEMHSGMKLVKIGNYGNGHHAKDVYDSKGLSPTITTGNHGLGTTIADSRGGLKIKNANSKGYLVANEGDGVDISTRMEHHRGTVQKKMSQTLTTQGGNNVGVVVDDKRS